MKCPYITQTTRLTKTTKFCTKEYVPENDAIEPFALWSADTVEIETEAHINCIKEQCMAYEKGKCTYK